MAEKKGKNKKNSGKKKNSFERKEVSQQFFYYYLSEKVLSVSDLAGACDLPDDRKELWIDYRCMELLLDADSMIFEDAAQDFVSEEDQALLSSLNIKTVYSVSFDERDQEAAMHILKQITSLCSGMICSDTEDFQPYIIENGEAVVSL